MMRATDNNFKMYTCMPFTSLSLILYDGISLQLVYLRGIKTPRITMLNNAFHCTSHEQQHSPT